MDRLAESISTTQTALLSGRLPELERGLSQQIAFCKQSLPHIKPNGARAIHDSEVVSSAKAALDRLRVFAAILRRMQGTLAAMQAATQGTPLTYGPPSCSGNASGWGR